MNFDALLLDGSTELLLLVDAQSMAIVAASPAAHRQLGYPPGELSGLPLVDIECALSDLFFWEEMATATAPLQAQSLYRRRDGSMFEVSKFVQRTGPGQTLYQLRASPVKTSKAEPEVNVVGLHLAATLEATEDGILLTDNDGAILNMNQRFSNLMALPDALLAERDDHGIVTYIESILLKSPGSADAPTALSQAIDLKLDLGGDTFETLYLADGRVVECVSHPARDRERTIGRVFCYRDVTERVQHEQFLQEARDIAEQATLSKGQFLANMSHEIRTPMNAILGMLNLMHATDLNERQFDYVSKAESAAQSLLGLLNDILDFSKIEAGKLELDLQPFSAERMLRELAVILSANVGTKPVELLYDIDPRIPRTMVGDAMRLQQVLINLGGNALKFTQSGEVILHMHVVEQGPNATRLRIGVRDTGIGIAAENQAKIFGDFSQAEASTTRRYGGTGLGLSICQRLIALMGGELKVDSALGRGSDFYFEIDFSHAPASNAQGAAPHAPLASSVTPDLDVLVVDNNPVALDLLVAMMRSLGWRVESACHGEDAMGKLSARVQQRTPYQAIFMDWDMPALDGWQTLAQMRKQGPDFGNPIIVMVGTNNRQAMAQRSAEEQQALSAFMVKPVTAAMLQEVIAEAQVATTDPRAKDRKPIKAKPQLQGMRLLLVEDNLMNQQVARELLRAQGADVHVVDNGLVAIGALKQSQTSNPFDAILMDVQMPVMDGFTATRVIRKELALTELPIIAMTANAMTSDREDCLNAGMDDHVGKPFNLNHLVQVLLQTTGFQPRSAEDTAVAPQAQPSTHPSHKPRADAASVRVDLETALAQFDGMTDLYLELARDFKAELDITVEAYHRSLSAGLVSDTMRLMHTLKGSAATMGIMPLSTLAKDLEQLCLTPDGAAAALAREGELAAMVSASISALDRAVKEVAATGGNG